MPEITVFLTSQDEANIIAAVALAAQQYADSSSLLDTLEKLSPACRRAADSIHEQLTEREAVNA